MLLDGQIKARRLEGTTQPNSEDVLPTRGVCLISSCLDSRAHRSSLIIFRILRLRRQDHHLPKMRPSGSDQAPPARHIETAHARLHEAD